MPYPDTTLPQRPRVAPSQQGQEQNQQQQQQQYMIQPPQQLRQLHQPQQPQQPGQLQQLQQLQQFQQAQAGIGPPTEKSSTLAASITTTMAKEAPRSPNLDQMDYDRCPNTGTWLLENQAFEDFVESSVSACFHLSGNPGSGCLIHLTAQLLEQISAIDPVFVRKSAEAFGIVRKKTNQIPEGQLFRVLHKCLQRMQECVIVVDAVDECDDWNNLMQIAMGIPYVISRLPVESKFRLDVTADQMESDISRYVESRTRTLDLRSLGSPEQAMDALIRGCDGLFLLSLAQLLFLWVVHAQRVLTVAELAEAYRAEILANDPTQTPTLSESEIEGLSGGLIEINDGRVRLAHTTVRHFVTVYDWGAQARANAADARAMNERLLLRCLGYIMTPALVSCILSSFELTAQTQCDWPLADYAQRTWFDHLQLCSGSNPDLVRLVGEFIQSDACLAWWMCYTTHLEMHNWWSIPEITADLAIWLRNNCKSYIPEEDAADVVSGLCQRHFEMMKAAKETPRVDLYVPTLLRLANQKFEYGFPEIAETCLQEAMEISRGHNIANATLIRIQVLQDRAELMRILARHDEALAISDELDAELARATESDLDRQVISVAMSRAITELESRNLEAAERIFRGLVDTARSTLDRNDPDTLSVIHWLAMTCFELGHYVEAGELWDIQLFRAVLGRTHPSTLSVMDCLSSLLSARGKCFEATALRREVDTLRRERLSNKTVAVFKGELGLAYGYHNEKNPDAALSIAKRLLDRARGSGPRITTWSWKLKRPCPNHSWTLQDKMRLALIQLGLSQYDKAADLLSDIVEIRRKDHASDHVSMHQVLDQLARAYRGVACQKGADEESVLVLNILAGICLTRESMGDRNEAERVQRELLESWKRIGGEENPSTLVTAANLSITLRNNGKAEEAAELGNWEAEAMEQTVYEKRAAKGAHREETYSAMTNLAVTKRHLKKWDEAERMEREVVEGRKKIHGTEDHPEVATALGNLALTLSELGRYEEAEVLEEKVIEIRMKSSPTDQDSDIAVGNIIITKQKLNKTEETETLQQQLVDIRKAMLASDDPKLTAAMASLATTKRKLRKFEEAEALELVVLEVRKRTLGPEDTTLLDAMGNLAVTQVQLGKYDEAAALEEFILETREKAEPDSNATLIARSNLAFTRVRLGRLEEALEMQEQVLAARQRQAREAGDEEFTTEVITAMGNLVSVKLDAAQYAEGIAMQEKVVALHEERKGRSDEATVSALAVLAMAYLWVDRNAEAEALCLEVLATRTEKLGPEHKDTVDAQVMLGDCYDMIGEADKSLEWFRKALDARERMYGRHHVYTLAALEAWRKDNLGERHPDTMRAYHKQAMILMTIGRFPEARELLAIALEYRIATFGLRNLDTLDSKEMLALGYCLDGQMGPGQELMTEVADGMAELLGPDHSRTKAALKAALL
ncbi:unnamed protein product [Parascedosporium putredinis]|uniref:TPR-like protein n=1 Tax=Parascedosporium putredinis TaxID=1442378 RepID=A0A9P1GX43_9PEZI|nr:unnamed protein product [Parascedosporium putredinis]CAI7990210.1 unnamed protein product [Parascedosporium putredinis]